MAAVKKQTRKAEVMDDVDHPVATGVGAGVGALAGASTGVLSGATLGAQMGTLAGPIGAAAGGVIGGIVGALAGEGIADTFDSKSHDTYWKENYKSRPYVNEGEDYNTYQSAYLYGAYEQSRDPDRSYEDAKPTLQEFWNKNRTDSDLEWDRAEPAIRDAYDRRPR
ncbi:MAG: hypothetical protein U1E36_09850 [Rickettsiales bacterium]